MAIIKFTKDYLAPYQSLMQIYPEQEVSDKEKQKDGWKKLNMDYWYTIALSQYNSRKDKIVRNYELLKGILKPDDFYEEATVTSFVDELLKDVDLPSYVQHYPILNPPLNTMVGEMTKRPDNVRAKAYDSDSQNEELDYYTSTYQQLIYDDAKSHIQKELLNKGIDVSNLEEFQQQVEQLTQDKIKDIMTSYTSTAERWANNILTSFRSEFNMKEKSEEAFRDLLVVNEEYLHIYEDKSKTGLAVDVCNAKNVWGLTTPDKKYSKNWYAGGLIEVMELSEILNKYTLTIEEIEHLREVAMTGFFPFARKSNLLEGKQGIDSITYDTYDPLVLNTRVGLESEMMRNDQQALDSFLGNIQPNIGTFGNKFIVVTAYWNSKKKMGLVTYIDKNGIPQSELVDEHYVEGTHPQEISVEWEWINQWYKGVKIGNDIYYVEPFKLLDYCPIIGVRHEIKNTLSRSLVDLMKPFQTLYNVCMNQLFRLLEKEPGNVFLMSKRHVPLSNEGDGQDSIQIWEEEARERGIIFIDDSPENMKSPSAFNQYKNFDLTYTNQIQSRYNLAVQLKNECWELVGLSRQRMGSVMATETATATNTALTQSYAQTEPYFAQHEYLMQQLYQAIIDAALYIETQKPESTVSYITDEGESKFLRVNTQMDLSMRDLKVFLTSRREDQIIFEKIQGLAEFALQNGTPMYDVAQFYTTNSVRQLKQNLKKLKEFQDQMAQNAQQQKQQELEQNAQATQATLEQNERHHQEQLQMDKYKADLTARTNITVAQIKNYFQGPSEDSNNNGTPDPIEIVAAYQEQQKLIQARDLANMKLLQDQQKIDDARMSNQDKMALEQEKLKVKREDILSKEKIAKMNKNKYDSGSKK